MSGESGATSVIAQSEVFAGLEPAEIAEIEQIAQRQPFKAGSRIFNLGEEATRMLLVESGTVRLALPLVVRGSAQEVTIDEKSNGAVIAWSALVPPHKLTLSGLAATDVLLLAVDRRELDEIFRASRRVQAVVLANLNRVIASRVGMLEALLIRELQRWVAERF
jgi:CRP-like cAMP-binding protein